MKLDDVVSYLMTVANASTSPAETHEKEFEEEYSRVRSKGEAS